MVSAIANKPIQGLKASRKMMNGMRLRSLKNENVHNSKTEVFFLLKIALKSKVFLKKKRSKLSWTTVSGALINCTKAKEYYETAERYDQNT